MSFRDNTVVLCDRIQNNDGKRADGSFLFPIPEICFVIFQL